SFVYALIYIFCLFFFFQAEDGIRDFHVTGVQTCALPIWSSQSCNAQLTSAASDTCSASSCLPTCASHCPRGSGQSSSSLVRCHRSEERRVGKESRFRW